VAVTLVRGEDLSRKTVDVRLMDAGELNAATAPQVAQSDGTDPLGIEVEALTPDIRRALDLPREVEGVVVSSVEEYGPFSRRSPLATNRGAVIMRVNRQPIASVEEYRAALEDVEPGDVVGLDVYSPTGGTRVPITVQIPR
jgi:S1-C subfamily serine protease